MKTTQVKVLRWAVGEAETWRGSMTGNPDEGPLERFDAAIAAAKEAVDQAGRDAKEMRRLRRRVAGLEERVRGLMS